jgi:TonB family protein
LKTCEDQLLADFGVDIAAQAAVATPPKQMSTMVKLFSNDDYPVAASRGRAQGAVSGRFRVTPDGAVTDCVVVISSGNPALDRETCAIWSSRGRFKPATAKDGRPISSAQIFTVNWSLPPR